MDSMIKKILPTLLIAAILAAFGAIWRFESVAGELENIKKEMKEHYTKKEEFVVVKNDLKHIRLKQEKMDAKVDIILQAVRK